jgi:hypothetical protein
MKARLMVGCATSRGFLGTDLFVPDAALLISRYISLRVPPKLTVDRTRRHRLDLRRAPARRAGYLQR